MSQLFDLLSNPTELIVQSRFGLLICDQPGSEQLQQLAAILSLQGPVKVLDAGNTFNVFDVAYTIRRLTVNLYQASDNIHIVRAFTCIEVLRGLEEMQAGGPVIILDLLATFYDQAVSNQRAQVLFDRCLEQIQRLKQAAPLVVSATANQGIGTPREKFLASLMAAADMVEVSAPAAKEESPRLF